MRNRINFFAGTVETVNENAATSVVGANLMLFVGRMQKRLIFRQRNLIFGGFDDDVARINENKFPRGMIFPAKNKVF